MVEGGSVYRLSCSTERAVCTYQIKTSKMTGFNICRQSLSCPPPPHPPTPTPLSRFLTRTALPQPRTSQQNSPRNPRRRRRYYIHTALKLAPASTTRARALPTAPPRSFAWRALPSIPRGADEFRSGIAAWVCDLLPGKLRPGNARSMPLTPVCVMTTGELQKSWWACNY